TVLKGAIRRKSATTDTVELQKLYLSPFQAAKQQKVIILKGGDQTWTDNSWGPKAIGDHGAPVSFPKLKKAYEKGTRGISWGPLQCP
ncbi:unnamed protein product, partial [Staurois parvus]